MTGIMKKPSSPPIRRAAAISDPLKIGAQPVKTKIRGFVNDISQDANELVRGGRTRDGYYFMIVDFYQVNDTNHRRFVGKAKVYIPTSAMGLSGSGENSIFYYPSPNPKDTKSVFQTPKANLHDLRNERVMIDGMLKDDTSDPPITHFMTKVERCVILIDPSKQKHR